MDYRLFSRMLVYHFANYIIYSSSYLYLVLWQTKAATELRANKAIEEIRKDQLEWQQGKPGLTI